MGAAAEGLDVTDGRTPSARKIDSLLDRAVKELAASHYFQAEADCLKALNLAYAAREYERVARVALPLLESRRRKFELATEAGRGGAVFLLDGEPPTGQDLVAGCYLIQPPRVGADGRLLREAADRHGVPVVIVVREPATRDGLWPVVSVGPVTMRTRVPPPQGAEGVPVAPPGAASPDPTPPSVEWFLATVEALGECGLAQIKPLATAAARVDALLLRVAAHPDHEGLHRALIGTCHEAAREGPVMVKAAKQPEGHEEEEAADDDGY